MIYKLEDRVLFDAALPVDVAGVADSIENTEVDDQVEESAADASQVDAPTEIQGEDQSSDLSQQLDDIAQPADLEASDPNEIYLIDSNVKSYDEIIDALPEDSEWYLLEADDGISDIVEMLEGRSDLDAIHILSHGSDGALRLGASELTADSLSLYTAELEAIGNSLSADGDILLYGCDVAKTENGEAFVNLLSQITDADVVASDDSTGFGGDWDLEFNAGIVEAASISTPGTNSDLVLGTIDMSDLSGGDITDGTIDSAADLIKLSNDSSMWGSDKAYLLTTGIDFSLASGSIDWNGDGTIDAGDAGGFTPIGASGFHADFDGQGNTITGLYTTSTANNWSGMFVYIKADAEITGVKLADANITGGDYYNGAFAYSNEGTITDCELIGGTLDGNYYFGGFVYQNQAAGTIDNCNSSMAITAEHSGVGALAYKNYGVISNSEFSGSINATGSIGGIVGMNEGGTISNCTFSGSIEGGSNIGGIVISNNVSGTNGRIVSCVASGTITSVAGYSVAGIASTNSANCSIIDSSSSININGSYNLGGLVYDNAGSISNSFATGTIVGDGGGIGGLVSTNSGLIESSGFSGTSITGRYNIGGIAAINDGGTISHSTFNSSINTTGSNCNYIGGIVAYNNASGLIVSSASSGTIAGSYSTYGGVAGINSAGSSIIDSSSSINVTGSSSIGGLVGNNDGSISRSFATGTVHANDSNAGGLVGVNTGSVDYSYATGDVSAAIRYVGGLIGSSSGANATVKNSFATGNTIAIQSVGGLIGTYDDLAAITNCYATGVATADYSRGGLIGGGASTNVSNSYYIENQNIDITGYSIVDGVLVVDSSIAGADNTPGMAVSAAAIMQAATFTGFNFAEGGDSTYGVHWSIDEGTASPTFQYDPISCAIDTTAMNQSAYNLSGTTTAKGALIGIYQDGSLIDSVVSDVTTGDWSYTYDASSLADGAYALTALHAARGEFLASPAAPSPAHSVVIDNTAPTVTSIVRKGATAVTNSSTIDFTVTLNDAGSGFDASTLQAADFAINSTGVTHDASVSVAYVSGGVYTVSLTNVAGDGTASITLNDGSFSDLAGNVYAGGDITGESYTLDNTAAAPSFALNADTGSSNSDLLTNDATVNVILASDVASWEYSLDGGSTWSAGTGTSFELADNTSYDAGKIQVRQTDSAGNVSSEASSAAVIETDMTAAAPGFALNADTGSNNSDLVTNDATVNVTLASDVASWEYSVDGGSTWTAGTGTSFELADDTSYAADQIQVRQADSAGNISSATSNAAAITTDMTAAVPAFALNADTGSSNSDLVTNDATVNVTLASDVASWEYSVDGGSSWSAGTGTSFELADNTTYDAGKIQVRQTDAAGNTSSAASSAATITTDMTAAAPTFALNTDTGSSNSDLVTNDATVNVTLASDVASWEYSVDGGTTWTTGSGTSFELADDTIYGAGEIEVRQTDAAGNTSSAVNNAATITTDMTAATPSFALNADTGSSNSDLVTNDATVNVTLASDVASWEYSVDGGTTWSTGTGTSFELADDTTYDAGKIQVRQTDAAGNTSSAVNNAAAIETDMTAAAPGFALNADTGSNNSDHLTNDATVNVTLASDVASWEYSLDGGATWIVGAGTSFELADNTTYDAGKIQVRQTDSAGNASSVASSAVAIEVDVTAPSATSDPVFLASVDSGEVVEISGTSDSSDIGLVVDIVVDGSVVATVNPDVNGDWSYELDTSSLGYGSFEVKSVARDAAGNQADSTISALEVTGEPEVVVPPVVEVPVDSPESPSDSFAVIEVAEPAGDGIGFDILFEDTGIETAVELHTGRQESTEDTMEKVAEEIDRVLSATESAPDFAFAMPLEFRDVGINDGVEMGLVDAVDSSPQENPLAPRSRVMTIEAFEDLGLDISGGLNVNEVQQHFKDVDFSKVDLNGDGVISEEELKEMLKNVDTESGADMPLTRILNESIHVLESAPVFAEAFQTPFSRALNDMLVG